MVFCRTLQNLCEYTFVLILISIMMKMCFIRISNRIYIRFKISLPDVPNFFAVTISELLRERPPQHIIMMDIEPLPTCRPTNSTNKYVERLHIH